MREAHEYWEALFVVAAFVAMPFLYEYAARIRFKYKSKGKSDIHD